MNRVKFLLTALAIVAILIAPAAFATTVHVVGAGSSAQFLTAALGADSLAIANEGAGQCPYHYSAKTAGNLTDNRDGAVIRNEPGNLWVVWLAACSDATGNTSITDIWADLSVDSTVGNRAFLAQEASGSGVQLALVLPPPAAGNLITPSSLWPDGNGDVAEPANIQTDLNNVHVNTGLTDIRPEDALFATARSYTAKNNCTGTGACSELGYSTSNAGVGAPIESDLSCPGSCSTSIANPVDFSITGSDPFTGLAIRTYTTIPIGAAPVVFVYNNNGEASGSYPTNLVTGIKPDTRETTYPLAALFEGTGACTDSNPAFTGGSSGVNVNLAIREPLSGTMNTTEFSLFRSDGSPDDSQEHGFNPQSQGTGYTAGANFNPLDLNCASGGKRVRGIGTSEIVKWVNTTANTLGYIFWGFANAQSVFGSHNANYNYLTVDSVDPIGISNAAAQNLPVCTGPCPAAGTLTGGGASWALDSNGHVNSFPNVRNGTYKAWSLYRWLVPSPDTDPGCVSTGHACGPTALAANTQQTIDTSYADYVPFVATSGTGGTATDPGLSVYHSHRGYCDEAAYPCPSGHSVTTTNCVSLSVPCPDNGPTSGNTLGGGVEAGSDVGGYVYGPFPGSGTNPAYTQAGGNQFDTITITAAGVVTWKTGEKFPTGVNNNWVGQDALLNASIDVNGVCQGTAYSISVVSSATKLTITGWSGGNVTVAFPACFPVETPGTLNKKQ